MDAKERNLIKNGFQLKKGLVILILMFGILILGYLSGKGLYHTLH